VYSKMSADDEREYADRIREARITRRRERAARRHAVRSGVRDFRLSIPAAVGVRLGG
jgi:hypothetical protein